MFFCAVKMWQIHEWDFSFDFSQIIQGAGHHVYADKKDMFNEIIQKASSLADFNAQKEAADDLIPPENSEVVRAPVSNDMPADNNSNNDIVVELNSSSELAAAAAAATAGGVNLSIQDPSKDSSALRD